MKRSTHARRITGLETEYGCLVEDPGESARIAHRVRNWIFDHHRYGLVDQHYRDWEEPPGNGGFLFNGGRLYIDMGHIEYCTPECASVRDVVRYSRAGDMMLLKAVEALGVRDTVHFIRNNVDHVSGATFGCHENYSLLREAPLTTENVGSLLTFLTLRLLFAGSGRVGGSVVHHGYRRTTDEGLPHYQISQRADYIENDLYEWVQHNRAIINTRDEPLADARMYRRLHLLHGDTNVLPSAQFLTVGSTRLVLDLLERDKLPQYVLADAVTSMRALSRTLEPPWNVTLENGRQADALEILAGYRELAQEAFRGRDAETDAILDLWVRVETGLRSDRESLVGLVDWITKHRLLDAFREQEDLSWNDAWLQSQDLEYHKIDPERGLGWAMTNLDGFWAHGFTDPTFETTPPVDTRAQARSRWMREVADAGKPYEIDWHFCRTGDENEVTFLDPFRTATS